MKNVKICIICGKEFYSSPSVNKVTCSDACRKKYAVIRSIGRKFSDETKAKLSDAGKQRNMSELQIIGTMAALESPNSGPFETNVNAKEWHLISPEGREYKFRSLNFWARENYHLFGFENPNDAQKVSAGIRGAKRGALGKETTKACTYKGWRVIIDG